MEDLEIKQLAKDLGTYHGISELEALHNMGFDENSKSIWLGNIEAAKKLGVVFSPSQE